MYFSRLVLVPLAISISVAPATRPYGSFPHSSKLSVDDQSRLSSPANEIEAQEINF
jgi:hypothetical protein